jgi:hypothetical protein
MSARPGISDQFLQAAGVHLVEEPDPQLRIPYHDRQGKRTGHSRSRLLKVRADGQKYDQSPGSGMQVYFSHLPLEICPRFILSEGEFKHLALRESGFQGCGLPCLHCYSRDINNNPQILPDLYEAIRFANPSQIVFIGDSDTATNLEFFRSIHFLATTFPGLSVRLVQLPLDGPKGVDDLRAELDGQFPARLETELEGCLEVDPKQSFLLPALIRIEAVAEVIHRLPSKEREPHIGRLVQMAAGARTSKDEPRSIIERFCDVAQKASRLTKLAFTESVEDEIRRLLGPDAQASTEEKDDIAAELGSLTPWPEALPLSEIFPEVLGCWKKYLVAGDDAHLIFAFMTVATFFYKETPYRPLLVLTSAEEESGKTTALRLIRRLAYRILSATSVSSGSIHRVFDHYDANLSIDEAKANLKEEPALITALNNGFDEESAVVLRWDTDAGVFIPFRTNCFKILAGIGSYLNHDTLSRSFVITLERATAEEYARVTDFAFCELSETEPIARKLLAWAHAHREIFRDLVLEMMRRLPTKFRGRVRQKFSVLYALAAWVDKDCCRKLDQAASRMLGQITGDVPLQHQLLADICGILEKQQELRARGDAKCKLKIVQRKGEPDREFIETTILINLLLTLSEGPWRAYGKNKKLLDGNGLFFLLKNYNIRTSEKKSIRGIEYRGLFVDVLLTAFERWKRQSESEPKASTGGATTADSGKPENPVSEVSESSEVVETEEIKLRHLPAGSMPDVGAGVGGQVIESEVVIPSADTPTPSIADSFTEPPPKAPPGEPPPSSTTRRKFIRHQ